jgi:hypothetical protein
VISGVIGNTWLYFLFNDTNTTLKMHLALNRWIFMVGIAMLSLVANASAIDAAETNSTGQSTGNFVYPSNCLVPIRIHLPSIRKRLIKSSV